MLLTEEELRRDLYQLNMSQTDIAEKHDCSRKTVRNRMDEYGLKNLPSLYAYTRTDDGRRIYKSDGDQCLEYQLVAIADGADPHAVFGGDHIHHINGCRLDNRPENLALLTPEEHATVESTDLTVDTEDGVMRKEIELTHY